MSVTEYGLKWVALRKESVDRNIAITYNIKEKSVALRKESVDRNNQIKISATITAVALRKESVDRNAFYVKKNRPSVGRSPQGERG